MDYDIKDLSMAGAGRARIEWARRRMPVLSMIRERFRKERPLEGLRVSACLHVTTETANLVEALTDGGAMVRLCASNPLSTQDDVAASLVRDSSLGVFAKRGDDRDAYYAHIEGALDHGPQVTMDDGADLISTVHSKKRDLLEGIVGGTEETTTGVVRLRSLEKAGELEYPVIAVNDSSTKYLFDNRYGTGQSTIDGIMRATNMLFAGARVVVCGYGWCARGIATRARGMGAIVAVTEVDPLRALEAAMDGFLVMPLAEAAPWGDLFVTSTGDTSVISKDYFPLMKEGAILCNAGHFDVEIDVAGLERMSKGHRPIRDEVEEYELPDGKRLYLLSQGRLINLSAAEGHPAMVMDMSFANQALSVEYLARNGTSLGNVVLSVPVEIDREIARMKLESMGIRIDSLTEEQRRYLASWELGT